MSMDSANRIKALIKLLETGQGQYTPLLKEELARAVRTNPDEVARVMTEEGNSSAPQTILRALEEICWEDLTAQFAAWSAKINPELEEGLALLAKFTAPTATLADLTHSVDELALALRPAVLNANDVREIVRACSHYIFTARKFAVLPSVTDIRDLAFPHFLRTGKGSALCMACLYHTLGARYGLDTEILDVAGRILLAVKDEARNDAFIVDMENDGKILPRENCKDYAIARGMAWRESLLTPLSSRDVVRRFIANMIFMLRKLHDERPLVYLRGYLDTLAR